MTEQEVRERYDALREHVRRLIDNAICYPSAIEIDCYSATPVDGDEWEQEARRLIA